MPVVVGPEVRVRVDMHVGIMSLGSSHGFLIDIERSGSAWRPSQLLQVTNATHCYWIPAFTAAAAVFITNS